MLDMNCDQKICETDVFTFMELHKDPTFFERVLIYDIQDILRTFAKGNSQLRATDKTMDYSDEAQPRIKNLPAYLEAAQVRSEQRSEVMAQSRQWMLDLVRFASQDIYASSAPNQAATIASEGDGSASKKGQPAVAIDPQDPYSSYGAEYKATLQRMTGSSKPEEKKADPQVKAKSKDKETQSKQVSRGGGVADQSLKEMRSQGAQQFAAEHKKKPMISYYIHKTDSIYQAQKKSKVFLTEDEFIENIEFRF